MIRPGAQVVLLGARGTGQVIRVDGDTCEVLWRTGRRRENCLQTELAWVGLTLHTTDGRTGRVVDLGKRGDVRVRLPDGRCCWMATDELTPRSLEREGESWLK